jgi:hypothetical protein
MVTVPLSFAVFNSDQLHVRVYEVAAVFETSGAQTLVWQLVALVAV